MIKTWLVLTILSVFWAETSQADVIVTHPYRGVTYITRTESFPRALALHIAKIDLTTLGIRFKLTAPGGTRDAVRQTTLDFLKLEKAQVAINAHFFLPFPSPDTDANLVGLAVSQGIIYSPFELQPVGPGYVNQGYAILPNAPALNIDAANHASIVHRDPAYPDNKHVLDPVTLWTTVAGSAQIVRDGVKTIPAYSGPPNGLTPTNGYSNTNSWYSLLVARSAIGLTRDNQTLVLFTVDAAGASSGMALGEVADLLLTDYAIFNALNLDGGGSTSMALEDPETHIGLIVNVSSDNPLGRAVGSNLGVFAQPLPEPVALLALAISSTNTARFSWPAHLAGWKLQQNPGLDSAGWRNSHPTPSPNGDRTELVILPQPATWFYRLVR